MLDNHLTCSASEKRERGWCSGFELKYVFHVGESWLYLKGKRKEPMERARGYVGKRRGD